MSSNQLTPENLDMLVKSVASEVNKWSANIVQAISVYGDKSPVVSDSQRRLGIAINNQNTLEALLNNYYYHNGNQGQGRSSGPSWR